MIVRIPSSKFSRRRSRVSVSFAAAIALALQIGVPLLGSDAGPQVELRCQIVPARTDQAYQLWKIEVRKGRGERVRQAVAASGETVRFKNLTPAIYAVCLLGERGRGRCQSVDLYPAPGQKAPVFVKKFETPLKAQSHQVSAWQLAVPEKARQEMFRSQEAERRGDPQPALHHLERAVEIYPKYIEALNNIGAHYQRAGNLDVATEYFTRVIRLDPRFSAGWFNLGASLLAAGNLDAALEANKRAVALHPDDTSALSQMALNCYYLRKYSDAKTYFAKLISLDPSSAEAPQLLLAQIAFAERRPREAQGYLRSYLELHPNSPDAPRLREKLQGFSENRYFKDEHSAQPQR